MSKFTETTSSLCERLNIHPVTLRRQRKLQFLRPGVHFISVGTGTAKPRLRWNFLAVEESLAKRSRKTPS